MSKIIDVINGLSNILPLKPASEEQIIEAEKALNLKFAQDYREYLANFGAIMADGIELKGVTKSEHRNVVNQTKQERILNAKIPMNMYVIENIGVDGIIIWQDVNGTVFKSIPNSEPIKIFENLAEYILNKNC